MWGRDQLVGEGPRAARLAVNQPATRHAHYLGARSDARSGLGPAGARREPLTAMAAATTTTTAAVAVAPDARDQALIDVDTW